MNLADVMDQVAERLTVMPVPNVYASPPGSVVAPAIVVGYPDNIEYDMTYGRGVDKMTLPLWVVVGHPTAPDTRDLLAGFCNGSGASSVKQVLESGEYDAFDNVRVAEMDTVDGKTIGATGYLVAEFTLEIAGPGSN